MSGDSRTSRTRRASQRANSTDGRRPRAGGGRSGSRRAAEPAMNPMVIAGIVGAGLLLVVLVAYSMSGGGNEVEAGGSKRAADSATSKAEKGTESTPAVVQPASGTAREGKTPDRPAPTIPDDVYPKLEGHYQTAKELWNDAIRAKGDGEHAVFTEKSHAAFEAMQKLEKEIEPYMFWYEEADLDDWAIPAEYDRLLEKLSTYDRLTQRIKKLMPIRQR